MRSDLWVTLLTAWKVSWIEWIDCTMCTVPVDTLLPTRALPCRVLVPPEYFAESQQLIFQQARSQAHHTTMKLLCSHILLACTIHLQWGSNLMALPRFWRKLASIRMSQCYSSLEMSPIHLIWYQRPRACQIFDHEICLHTHNENCWDLCS